MKENNYGELRIRLARLADAAYFVNLLGGDHDTVQSMGSMPWPMTLESAGIWLHERLSAGVRIHALVREVDGAFLGTVGYGLANEHVEVGFWVGRIHRGAGVATRGLALALEAACREGARKAVARIFPDNPASARVVMNNGFEFTGEAEEYLPLRGGIRRLAVYERSL